MAPKEDANRLLVVEKAISQHEDGIERLSHQYADLREGLTRLENQQAKEFQLLTATMNKFGDNIQNLSIRSDPPLLKPMAPPDLTQPGRLNPDAASLLGAALMGSDHQRNMLVTPQNIPGLMQKLPRVDFPKFNGKQVRSWIQKAHRFFLLHPMEDKQKILFASLNFSDTADTWFQTDPIKFASLGWNEFSILIQHRFSEDLSDNVIGAFKLLHQQSTVNEYQNEFEQLHPLVLLQNPGLSEQYFVDCCIAGLADNIRHSVQMFYSSTVPSVFALSRLQEATVASRGKGKYTKPCSHLQPYSPQKNSANYSSYGSHNAAAKSDFYIESGETDYTKSSQVQPKIKKLSPAEIQERRAKSLCYNCDEIWSIKHKCKAKQLFLIIGDCEESPELLDTASDPVPSGSSAPVIPTEVAISLNALSGNASYQTLLLKGRVKNRTITMLVDTGSMHNFLDTNTAKQLGCICSETPEHQVLVAGGGHLTCDKLCQTFCWEINGTQFSSDVRLLPLEDAIWSWEYNG